MVTAIAAAACAVLLSACSGSLPLLSGVEDPQAGVGDAAPVLAMAKRQRTTARDILLEWSTYGVDRRPYKRPRTASVTPTLDAVTMPDYSMSINEIVANEVCRSCEQKPYHHQVLQASSQYGVPPGVIHAVIQKESRYNPAATSKKRARGLMQVTPGTGKFVGVDNSQKLYDPQTNINAGTAYLKYLMQNHDTFDKVLAAYNSGPGNVRKYNGVPPFNETRRYVVDVKRFYATTSRDEP